MKRLKTSYFVSFWLIALYNNYSTIYLNPKVSKIFMRNIIIGDMFDLKSKEKQ